MRSKIFLSAPIEKLLLKILSIAERSEARRKLTKIIERNSLLERETDELCVRLLKLPYL